MCVVWGRGEKCFSLFWSLNCPFANGDIFFIQKETMDEVTY